MRLVCNEDAARKCTDYVLQVLLGEDYQELCSAGTITYGAHDSPSPSNAVVIVSSGFFSKHYGKPESLPTLPLQEIEGTPLLYGVPRIQRSEAGGLVVYADIVASAFFLVTRYEEIVRRGTRDEHGRFPGRESLPYRAGFIHRPIVDEYAALLRKWLRQIGVDVAAPKKEWSILLTHDVDNLRMYRRRSCALRTTASAILRRRPLGRILDSLGIAFGLKRDPFNTFSELIALDGSLGAGSARGPQDSMYFFMARNAHQFDARYDAQSRMSRRTIRRVVESGATLGLHASYEAGLHPELIAQEKARLEEACGFPIRHNRHHYLAWREIEDGWALARAGIDWDSTLGYADVAGFRLGVCRPIQLFDPISLKPFGIEEHPLIAMESSLSLPRYMGLSEDEAFDHCKRLLDRTRKHNGEFIILWHNTLFLSSYHSRLYRRLLACAEDELRELA